MLPASTVETKSLSWLSRIGGNLWLPRIILGHLMRDQPLCFSARDQQREKPMTRFTTSSILAAAAVALSALAGLSNTLAAQTYPSGPVRFIVPFAAGGPSDNAARIVGEALSKRLGQAFIIENGPGAGGLLAAPAVPGAAPDGHTLLHSASAILA